MSARSRKSATLAVLPLSPAAASDTATAVLLPVDRPRQAPEVAVEDTPAYWRRFYEE